MLSTQGRKVCKVLAKPWGAAAGRGGEKRRQGAALQSGFAANGTARPEVSPHRFCRAVFVVNFVVNFVDKARDKARDKVLGCGVFARLEV
jgi:hypothetical protein